jgi:hypothetical protein
MGVAAFDVELRPVVHHDVEDPGDGIGDVAHLTGGRPDHRADVLRPAPAWIQPDSTDRDLVELDELEQTGAERPCAIGLVERLSLQPGHAAPFCVGRRR